MEQDNPAKRAATEAAVSRMEWEGAPLPINNSRRELAIQAATEIMEWEGAPLPGVEPVVKNSRFPERVMVEAPVVTSGIGEVVGPVGQPK